MSDRRIVINAGDVTLEGNLNDTPTADMVWNALPISAVARTWGDEIYFSSGLGTENDDTAQEVVEVGTIGYWPPGDALAVFFGATPASQGDEPRAASPVNPVGEVEGDATQLRAVRSGQTVEVRKA
ncbi:MAG: cyclophilin-like fold protein [Chloroflexota bacterium]